MFQSVRVPFKMFCSGVKTSAEAIAMALIDYKETGENDEWLEELQCDPCDQPRFLFGHGRSPLACGELGRPSM